MTGSVPFLEIREVGGATVFGFTRPDMTDAGFITHVGDELYNRVKDLDRPRVIVDFGQVERLSSATLGMLVALRKVVNKMDGELRVANVADNLIEIFKMTRLDVTLRVCKDIDTAVESFKDKKGARK